VIGATQPGSLRLRTQRDFRGVYGRGRRASGEWLTVVVWPRQTGQVPGPRIGVSVSKDHGGAVRRNKIKRLLREAFRLERHRMPPDIDVVLIPKRRDDNVPLAGLQQELVPLIQKALSKKPRGRHPRRRAK